MRKVEKYTEEEFIDDLINNLYENSNFYKLSISRNTNKCINLKIEYKLKKE